MSILRSSRAVLLAMTLLSACAAADPSSDPSARSSADGSGGGVYGSFLIGQFAMSEGDPNEAATRYLRALAADPTSTELAEHAFIACALSGRQEAVQLARELPDNQAAQLLLGNTEARAGNWASAEQHFRSLPRQGLGQLQPLLVAWVQAGAGRTDAAIATLRPLIDGHRFGGAYTLHAAMILDLAGNKPEAAHYYRQAQQEFTGLDLRLVQIFASWEMRDGHPAEAMHLLGQVSDGAPYLQLALPGLMADANKRVITRPTDGIAEAYVALAASLRQQDAGDFALLLLRFALDLRPDLTAARLMGSEIMTEQHHLEDALQVLAPIANDDPLGAPARLQRAILTDRLGHTDEALKQLDRLGHDYPTSLLPPEQAGDILRVKGRFAEAIVAYNDAIARVKTPSPGDWALYYSRGISYDRAHDWQKAQADFEHALAMAPDQPAVLNYLGYSWADSGTHLQQARQMIEKAVQQRPNDGAIIDSLGWVMLRDGDAKGAVKTLERAVELEPQDATINGHLGDAYWAAGRKLEATFQWRLALTLNPEPEDKVKLEARLTSGHPPAMAGRP